MQPNGLALPLLLGALCLGVPLAQANPQHHQFDYRVRSAPAEELHMETPKLPDLSGYTKDAVLAKIPRGHKGKVVVRRMLRQDALKDFTGGNERLREWIERQQGMPHAIFIEGGRVHHEILATELVRHVGERVLLHIQADRTVEQLADGHRNRSVNQAECFHRGVEIVSTHEIVQIVRC